MATKKWRITLNLNAEEKENFEFYKKKNRLVGSNAAILKKLALNSMNASVNNDVKRVLITDDSARKLRTLLIEITNVLNDILTHYKYTNSSSSNDAVLQQLQAVQEAVTDRWQSLL